MKTFQQTLQAVAAVHLRLGRPLYKMPMHHCGVLASGFSLQVPIEQRFLATPVRLPEIWLVPRV